MPWPVLRSGMIIAWNCEPGPGGRQDHSNCHGEMCRFLAWALIVSLSSIFSLVPLRRPPTLAPYHSRLSTMAVYDALLVHWHNAGRESRNHGWTEG